MSHLYVPIFGSAVIVGLVVLRHRESGKSAWMMTGTKIANGLMKLGCLTEAGFTAVELSAKKFVELYRQNKAAQGLQPTKERTEWQDAN